MDTMFTAKMRQVGGAVQSLSEHVQRNLSEVYDKFKRATSGAQQSDNDKSISFSEAARILRVELSYPEDRAQHFVRLFDKNGDGQLSVAEFEHFKTKIRETKAQLDPKFAEYDLDRSGSISFDEAATILCQPPFKLPRDKVALMLKQFDRDGNGMLDYGEFTCFYAEAKASNEDMASRFDKLDTDGNGTLSHEELVSIIREKMGLDEQNAREFVDLFDENHDGQIDKNEFVNMWSSMFG